MEPKPALEADRDGSQADSAGHQGGEAFYYSCAAAQGGAHCGGPAQVPQAKPSTAPVHFGETFGVTPNPNATRPATVAAIGNPYGGMNGPGGCATGSGGFDGHRQWNQVRIERRSRWPGGFGGDSGRHRELPLRARMSGKVASAGIPAMTIASNTSADGSCPGFNQS